MVGVVIGDEEVFEVLLIVVFYEILVVDYDLLDCLVDVGVV